MPDVSAWANSRAKRILDIVGASVLLLATLPFLAFVAVSVLVTEGRPVLFRQERVGRDGELFTLYKVRTMHNDGAPSVTDSIKTGSSAIFPLGSVIRRTKLDELPQLYNVVAGDMSLIGPRPLPLEVEATLPPEGIAWRRRVRPGLTGLAQVRCGRRASWAERVRYDAHYAETASLGLELSIAMDTLVHMSRNPDKV